MTKEGLLYLLRDLDDSDEILFVSLREDGISQVDEIAFEIGVANGYDTAFYLYSKEAIDDYRRKEIG